MVADVTPAEQIRAALHHEPMCNVYKKHAPGTLDLLCNCSRREALDALDALEAEHAEKSEAELAQAGREMHDQVQAEHADRVWLTRDEAKGIRDWLVTNPVYGPTAIRLRALLDERIGDGP